MSAQIDAAGDESETAEGKVKMLADGVMGAGDAASETDPKFDAMTGMVIDAGREAGVTGPLFDTMTGEVTAAGMAAGLVSEAARMAARTQASYADSQRIVDEVTANADARLEAYAIRLRLASMEVATADRSLGLMAEVTNRAAGSVDQLAHDMDLLDGDVSDLFQNIMTVAVPAVSELDQRIADMTMKITDTQTEAGLAEMAFAALSPELQEAARELGLFGMRVMEVAETAANAARRVGSSSSSGRRSTGGTQTSTVTINADGSITYGEAFGGDESGPASQGPGQQLYTNAAGSVFYDPNLLNPASDEAQAAFDMLTNSINETTMATGDLDNALAGNTLTDSLRSAQQGTVSWETVLADMIGTIEETQTATELQMKALENLPPGLRAAAEELGLFGLRVKEVAAGLGGVVGGETFDERIERLNRPFRASMADDDFQERLRQRAIQTVGEDFTGYVQIGGINIYLDGSQIATASTRAQSEGAG